jgi:hypothetical protein
MKKIVSLTISMLFLVGFASHLTAQGDVTKAKAKFIYNFTRYIEWPIETLNGEFVIYVYGSSVIYNELKDYTQGKLVGRRSITIKNVSTIDGIDNCSLLFVAFEKTKELKTITSKLNKSKTIIISEKDGALEEGSAINFLLDDNKIAYEIKRSNAEKAGLKLNSLLVTYAKRKS